MIGTPSNLEVLLHCHYSPEIHPRIDAPAVKEGLDYLLRTSMIEFGSGRFIYKTTAKGRAYIDYLMQVPFPEQHWFVPGTILDGPL